MADYKALIPFIKKWEGGFVNDPADAGGATNMGVTIGTYTSYCRRKGYPLPTIDRLKNMSCSTWEDIFKTLYWDRVNADKIKNQPIANILVDWVWGSGKHGILIPQRLLGVKQDGIVGEETLKAINNADPAKLFQAIYEERKRFLERITVGSVKRYEESIGRKATEKELLRHTNKRFLKGWMNRLEDIRKFSL